MKTLLTISVLVSISSSGMASMIRGYLVEENHAVYFSGINEEQVQTDLPISSFKGVHIQLMKSCMKKRKTHLIEVEAVIQLFTQPSSIPGKFSYHSEILIEKVSCRSASSIYKAIARK